MRTLLCGEFADFVGQRFPAAGLASPCAPEACLGAGHVRARAAMVASRAGIPVAELLGRFGMVLFARLVRAYPAFFVGMESTVDLVARYETHFVAEVAKLTPTFSLPSLRLVRTARRPAEVHYRSTSGLADLAEGMLLGSVAHFADPFTVRRREPLDASGCRACFLLERRRGGVGRVSLAG